MDLYNINAALSQGNAITQQTELYNEQINQARDDIKNYYKDRLDKDNTQEDEDDYLYGAEDLGSAIMTGFTSTHFKNAFKDFQDSETMAEFMGKQFERGREANPLFYGLGGLAGSGGKKVGKILTEGGGKVGSGVLALGGDIVDSIRQQTDPAQMAERDLAYERSVRRPARVATANPPPAEPEAPIPSGAEQPADPRVSRALNRDASGADAGDGQGAPVRPDENPVPVANDLESRTIRVAPAPRGGLVARRQRRIQQQIEQQRPVAEREPEPQPEAVAEPAPAPAPVAEPAPAAPVSVRGNEIDFKLNNQRGSQLVLTDEFGNEYRHLDHVGNSYLNPEVNDPDAFSNKLDLFEASQFKQNNPNSRLHRVLDSDTGFVQDRVYLNQPSSDQLEQLNEQTLPDLRQQQAEGKIPQRPEGAPAPADQPQPTNVGVQDTSAGTTGGDEPLTDLQRSDFREAQINGTIDPSKVPAEARMSDAELLEARNQRVAPVGIPAAPPPPAGPAPVTGRRAPRRPAAAEPAPAPVAEPAPAAPAAAPAQPVSTIAGPRPAPLEGGAAPPRPEPSTISTIAGPRTSPLQAGEGTGVAPSGEAPPSGVRGPLAPSADADGPRPTPPPNVPDEGGGSLYQSLKEFSESAGVKTATKIGANVMGGLDIYDYFKSGEKFQEANSAENWGDRLTALGTVFDVVGTVNPLLEATGGVLSLAGTIASTIGEHEEDVKKATVTDPNNETQELEPLKTKTNPSFQALGQVASQNNHLQANSSYATF